MVKDHKLFAASGEPDRVLRRVERDAVLACAAMTVIAAAIAPAHLYAAAGVAGGGALASVSYRGIKAGIDAAVSAGETPQNVARTRASGLVKFFTRYVILAAAAYVIMVGLRLPPVAVVAGASSIVVAIALEAVRSFRANPRQHVEPERNRVEERSRARR
jgi:hypothetical protein